MYCVSNGLWNIFLWLWLWIVAMELVVYQASSNELFLLQSTYILIIIVSLFLFELLNSCFVFLTGFKNLPYCLKNTSFLSFLSHLLFCSKFKVVKWLSFVSWFEIFKNNSRDVSLFEIFAIINAEKVIMKLTIYSSSIIAFSNKYFNLFLLQKYK